MRREIIVIVGPTSSGKSALAIELARKFGGEVISADSRQVYRGLDIGSGKMTKREMKGIRHHLLDVTPPKKVFTAHDFVILGRKALEDILRRGKMPIICGGTGFYIDVLLGRVSLPDVQAHPKLRVQLREKSAAQLYNMLKQLDPRRARTIDRHNPVRLIRAIEIAHVLGHVPQHKSFVNPYVAKWIGLKPDNKTLRTKIHKRLLQRMKKGMVTEAQNLHAQGLSWARMEQLGLEYRYLARFLQRKISKSEMLENLERDIWRYAKRQTTYWRKNKEIQWFPSTINAFRAFAK